MYVWRFAIGEAEKRQTPKMLLTLGAPAPIYGVGDWVQIAELMPRLHCRIAPGRVPAPRFFSLPVAMLRKTGRSVSGWIVITRTAQLSVAI